ncbi:hypothetical protein J4404_00540 [Candidatus Woesearchaeota archaeon]|nr:hypothetical protein [Candidatus Woesearchaeota archaeon]
MSEIIKDLVHNLKDKFGEDIKFESQNSNEINFYESHLLYQIAVLGSEKKILFLDIRIPPGESKDELENYVYPYKSQARKIDDFLSYFCAKKGLGYTRSVKYIQ